MPKIKILTCLFVLFQVISIAFGQSYAIAGYNVTATSGTSSASYTSLKAAFDAINNGTHRGNIKILVTSNSTETNTAQINASGTGGANYTSVLLYPQSSGITISGNIGDKGLIYLNGADRFSINGSVNADGFFADMTLQNTGGCVISFNNGASDNSIKYAKIKASGNSTALIKSPNDAAGFNDRDSIIGCHLTSVSASQRPYTALEIVWTGSSSTYNGLTISNNLFYDLWNTNNTSYNLYILTDGTSNGIKITDNHFYESISFLPGGNNNYYHIFLNNLNSNSNIISGNYFGGTTPECGGNALSIGNSTESSNRDVNYFPLYLNLGASTVSQITDNQISNIQLKTASSDPFRAIYVFRGSVEISNNTIGSSTGNNNIYLTATNKSSTSYGIYVNQSENAIITNNAIGSITTANTSNEGHGFYGIYKQTWDNGVLKINDNYIGSRDTPNSIQCLSPSSKNNSTQMVVGISAGSNSGAEVKGNIVGSLSNFSTNNRTDNSIYGIIVSANGYNLIDRNFVFGLTATFSGPNGIMAGIYVDKGHNTISNNVVYIGEGNSSGLFPIYGIADYNDEKVDGYYNYNTVYLAGTVTGTSTANTAAFYKANWGEHAHLTNNILVNMRSGGGTSSGENTALNIENTQMTSLVNSDYNDLYVNPNSPNSYLGSLGSQNYNDLSTWTTSTGSDDNSISINPEFISVGNDPTGFIPTADLTGTSLDGTDFDGTNRPDTPSMGAWETSQLPELPPQVGIHWTGDYDIDWNKSINWKPKKIPDQNWPAIIPLRSNQPTILNGTNAVAKKLSIFSGAILTIDGGGTLNVINDISNSNGTEGIVINSSSSGTGSMICNVNGVQGTVKRYIGGGSADWHFLSTPVSGQSIHNSSWTPVGTSTQINYGDGTRYDLYTWDEPTSCWVYNLNNSIAPKWSTIHNNSDQFIPGRGYLYALLDQNTTKIYSGLFNNGVIYQSLTTSSDSVALKGFNFIGNPYPSSIDWSISAGFTRNMLKLDGGGYDMWIWSGSTNNYLVYNSSDAAGTALVAPMQGFFVYASSGGTFGFNNAARVHAGASDWLKSAPDGSAGKIKLIVNAPDKKGSDEIQMRFGYNGNDEGAYKLFSNVKTAPSLFIPYYNKNYAVRRLTTAEDNKKTPLSFRAGVDGKYSITCQFDPTVTDKIFLEDKITGTIHDFSQSDTYTFTAKPGDLQSRFAIHLGEIVPEDNIDLFAVYARAGVLYVDLSNLNDEYEVAVYDLGGKAIHKAKVFGGDVEEVSLSTRGIYMVSLRSQKSSVTKKVVY